MLVSLPYQNITIKGDLGYRISKNYTRLEEWDYQPAHLFGSLHGWPGDWPGRAILALAKHTQLSRRYPVWLDRILDALEEKMTPDGFLGGKNPDVINEQAVSGHNWMLRGLLELWLWRKDERALRMAHRLVKELYLPLLGHYHDYPTDPAVRDYDGGADGHLSGDAVCGWYLSTDIGCAYMSLDALSLYYHLFKDEKVLALLTEMVETFVTIDFCGASMQTHASLAATRGMLLLYQDTGREELLTFAKDFFALYKAKGMTENYANMNWFVRPSWTEPCAIVDSMLVATELFKITGEEKYLEDANRIYYNGLRYAQRSSGGFGCDECPAVGYEGKTFLQAQAIHYEAAWCCSMRGADGLTYLASNAVLSAEDALTFGFYFDGTYRLNGYTAEIRSEFPAEGKIRITLTGENVPKTLRWYYPANCDLTAAKLSRDGEEIAYTAENGLLCCEGGAGEYLLTFPMEVKELGTIGESDIPMKTYWRGTELLGLEMLPENEPWQEHLDALRPLDISITTPKDDLIPRKFRVVFEK